MSRRSLAWLIALAAAGLLGWLFPPFHVVPLKPAGPPPGAFEPGAFARDFWEKQLLPAATQSIQAAELLRALASDPKSARARLGRSPGLSSTTYFLVRGSGRVAAIEPEAVRLELDGGPPEPAIELCSGLLFGNTLRDASGLLDPGKFPNSQDFNDVSTALNHIFETTVSPGLRTQAAVGKRIQFTGCIELEEGDPPKVLPVVPVSIQWL